MDNRKKSLYVLLAGILLSLPFLVPTEGWAIKKIELLEVTGIFEDIDLTVEPNIIELNVNGTKAFGPLRQDCRFFDEKRQDVDKETFIKSYLKRVVTLEIVEDTGEVFSCRVGS